jgi:ComF family protein
LRGWSQCVATVARVAPRVATYGVVARVASRGLSAARVLLPQACALCRAPSAAALLCADCIAALPALGPACPLCALPVDDAGPCAPCRRHGRAWQRAIGAWLYAFPVDRLVQQLKYGRHLALADALGAGLAAAVRCVGPPWPDAIVPLPLATARQRERGFNQSQLIAHTLARELRRPLVHGLVRVRDDGPQAALAGPRRVANIHGAFAARVALDGLHVAIVDDVMTTGATLAAATRAARDAGAARVDVHVVARTLPP